MKTAGTLALLLTCLVSVNRAAAAPGSDFYIEQSVRRYFTLPEDARSLALGGTMQAVAHDSSAMIHNPAGFGRMNVREVSGSAGSSRTDGLEFLSHNPIDQTEDRGYITVAVPLGSTDSGPAQSSTAPVSYTHLTLPTKRIV